MVAERKAGVKIQTGTGRRGVRWRKRSCKGSYKYFPIRYTGLGLWFPIFAIFVRVSQAAELEIQDSDVNG